MAVQHGGMPDCGCAGIALATVTVHAAAGARTCFKLSQKAVVKPTRPVCKPACASGLANCIGSALCKVNCCMNVIQATGEPDCACGMGSHACKGMQRENQKHWHIEQSGQPQTSRALPRQVTLELTLVITICLERMQICLSGPAATAERHNVPPQQDFQYLCNWCIRRAGKKYGAIYKEPKALHNNPIITVERVVG